MIARLPRPEPDLRRVFAAIAESESGLSRRQIEQKTNLTHLAVKNALSTLADRGFIDITPYDNCAKLPMNHPVPIIRSKFCVIGLKILPSEVLGVVTDLRCTVLRVGTDGEELTAVRELPGGQHDQERVVRALAEVVQELVEQVPEGYRVLGTGVELGGHVNHLLGVVVYSPNLQWEDVHLGERLEEVLANQLTPRLLERFEPTGFDVVVENDVNALAAEAQWLGAGSGYESFAVVLVGDGIGCGLVINNELVHGATGIAGEIGHLVIERENPSLICRCGKNGCLEAIATIPMILQAIARARKERGEDPPGTIADAVKLADEGNELAKSAFDVAGDALARAISYLLNLVNPELLIFDTYEPTVTELLMPVIAKHLQNYCFSTAQSDCDIAIMEVDLDRGAKGAAALMITRLLSQGLPIPVLGRGMP